MQTLTITVTDTKVLKLLEDLESLQLIRVLKKETDQPKQKLSERLYGSLSDEQVKKMHKELLQMRNEWDRGI
ncbi:MAG: hypothetical protein HYR67_00100 [Bacteroidetes bacterium]|nr:hypothetical protein [Bacteroidota bacterium]